MWGDECYYNIEGECEFFQDWIMQTKDEVLKILVDNRVYFIILKNSHTLGKRIQDSTSIN